jgi:hypothetical protein
MTPSKLPAYDSEKPVSRHARISFFYGLFVLAFLAVLALALLAIQVLRVPANPALKAAHSLGSAAVFAWLGSLAGLVMGMIGLAQGGRSRKPALWGIAINGLVFLGVVAALTFHSQGETGSRPGIVANEVGNGHGPSAKVPVTSDVAAVRSVAAKVLGIRENDIPPNVPLSNPPMRANELKLWELVMELEQRMGIIISDQDLQVAADSTVPAQLHSRLTIEALALTAGGSFSLTRSSIWRICCAWPNPGPWALPSTTSCRPRCTGYWF